VYVNQYNCLDNSNGKRVNDYKKNPGESFEREKDSIQVNNTKILFRISTEHPTGFCNPCPRVARIGTQVTFLDTVGVSAAD
jgi:hypothetical protein